MKHPLSAAQQRLWGAERQSPGTSLFNLTATVHLDGPLDVPALERSLDEIVRRHEILRTTFAELDGRPWQSVQPPAHHPLERMEPDAPSPEVRFELAAAPPLHLQLVRLGADAHLLRI